MVALHIALKDLRLLSRDRVALFWVFGFPLLFAVLFGTVIASANDTEKRVTAVVVSDESNTAVGAEVTAAITRHPGFDARVASVEDAQDAVRRGQVPVWIRVPPGYGNGPSLELVGDPSRGAETALVRGELPRIVGQSAAVPVPAGDAELVTVARSSRSPYDVAFPAALLWGLLGCAATFAVALVSERTAGTDIRLLTAPVSRGQVLMGKALACFFACLADALLLLGVGRLALGVTVGSVLAALGAILCLAVCFVGLTLLLGSLGKTEQSVAGAGWATLILFAMIGGAMVPLAAMPDWMVTLSDVSPVKWGIFMLEGALWRDFTALEMAGPACVLLGMGAAGFFIGLEMFARQRA